MTGRLPAYDKSALPRPVLPGRDGWLALWDLAWELLFRNVKDPGIPGWKPYLTCFPGVDMIWQWDSCVMAFLTNWSNGTVSAFDNLDDLYALRRESDGFMAMAYDTRTGLPSYPEFDGRINPPLMAWAEREYLLATGDASRLPRVLPALEGFFGFVEARRRRCCGLYYFEDPGSSGMDNSPRGGYCAAQNLGSDVTSAATSASWTWPASRRSPRAASRTSPARSATARRPRATKRSTTASAASWTASTGARATASTTTSSRATGRRTA